MTNALKMFAVLSIACATASADAPKPAPAPTAPASKPAPTAKPGAKPAACKPSGAVIFEIDHMAEPDAKLSTSSTKVYANGAWTKDEFDADMKPAPQVAGCYAKADNDKLKANLTGAEWKVTTAQVHCMAMSQTYVVYKVNDKPIFTRKLCNGQSLDEKSMTKLQAAIAQVEVMVPAQE